MNSSATSTILRKAKGVMLNRFPLMINCREFEEFILDYQEGTLPKRQRRIFEFHIRLCRECRDYLAAYRRTMEVSKRLYEETDAALPEDVPEDLIRAILAARNQ